MKFPLEQRKKIFHWIATVGMVVFVVFLLLILISLHACSGPVPTLR